MTLSRDSRDSLRLIGNSWSLPRTKNMCVLLPPSMTDNWRSKAILVTGTRSDFMGSFIHPSTHPFDESTETHILYLSSLFSLMWSPPHDEAALMIDLTIVAARLVGRVPCLYPKTIWRRAVSGTWVLSVAFLKVCAHEVFAPTRYYFGGSVQIRLRVFELEISGILFACDVYTMN